MPELRRATLNVTNACNLRCKHCYTSGGAALENELTLPEIRGILTQLYELGVFELQISGGEPLVRGDLEEIIRLAHEMDFYITLFTNGTLVNDRFVGLLQEVKSSVKCVQVPLDGLREANDALRGQGSFELAVKAIKALVAAGLPVHVGTTVTRWSQSDIRGLAALVAELGAGSYSLQEFLPLGRGTGLIAELSLGAEEKLRFREVLESLREEYRGRLAIWGSEYMRLGDQRDGDAPAQFLCGALRGDYLNIMADGVVTPCCVVPMYAGNVRVESLRAIWENSLVLKAFRGFDPARLTGACGRCEYKYACGGCRMLAFLFTGDFYGEDPMCFLSGRELARCR
ncbi:MAG: radical SAM protein [Desulfotomaculales bacterium]